jgi:hypothetical protein
MDLLKEIHEYASSLEGCFHRAQWPNVFHGLDRADCRKSMPLTFESNKKGKAAKKAIIETFFPRFGEPCPYYRGSSGPNVTKKPDIKCGDNSTLVFTDADKFYSKFEVCNGKQESCRAFLFRELEKLGQRPQSNWDTEAMKEIYQGLVDDKKKSSHDEVNIPIEHLCIECLFCRRSETAIDHPIPYKCFRAAHRKGADWYFSADSKACSNFNPSSISCSNCKTDKTTCGSMYPADYMYKEMKPCDKYTSQMPQKKYVDTKTGRLIFVRSGIGGDTFKAMYQDAGKWGGHSAHGVKSPELSWRKTPEEAQADLDAYAAKKGWKEHIEEKKEVDEVRIGNSEKCEFKDEQCPYYCNHNEGCALKLSQGDVLVDMVSKLSQYNCDVYFDTKERCLGAEKSNDVHVDLINTNEAAPAATFDYSTVDNDTASFLQEKEQKITQIRMMSVMAIGKEIKEVHEKLANNKTGTFQKWCRSIGISEDTVRNYIRAYDYIAENFGNIEAAENIQPSLLFAISKPSAPKELQEKVLSGDITSHKQYKEMEEKLKAIEGAAKTAIEASKKNLERADKAEAKAKELDESLRKLTKAHAVSPAEVEKLKKELEEANRQVEILTDELMKPVEVEPAVVEKVPEETERELNKLREKTSLRQDYMYVSDMMNMLRIAHHEILHNWAKVTAKENSATRIGEIRNELINLGTKIESMIDYLDEESQMK